MSGIYYFVCVIFGLPFLLFYLFFIIYYLCRCYRKCCKRRFIKNNPYNNKLINYDGLLESSIL